MCKCFGFLKERAIRLREKNVVGKVPSLGAMYIGYKFEFEWKSMVRGIIETQLKYILILRMG